MTQSADLSATPLPAASRALKMWRGWRQACPNCGEGPLYWKYLKLTPTCHHCGTELGSIRADDFPPYVTMFIVGHIVVPLILFAEQYLAPPTWLHLLVWPVFALFLMLFLLPRAKGAIVGLMCHLRIKGTEFQ